MLSSKLFKIHRHSFFLKQSINLVFSSTKSSNEKLRPPPSIKVKTPIGKLDDNVHPDQEKEPLKKHPNNINPETGEVGGPAGPEPTRYGDWERRGKCVDF